jgi:WG containing repeat
MYAKTQAGRQNREDVIIVVGTRVRSLYKECPGGIHYRTARDSAYNVRPYTGYLVEAKTMKALASLSLILGLTCGSALAQIAVREGAEPPRPEVGLAPRNLITLTNPRATDTLYPVSVNNWWGYMNQRGQLVVFPRYDWADDFYDGLARAVLDGKTGYIKGNGNWILDPVYPYADRFEDGRAIVGDGEQFGFIQKSGKLLVPVRLDGALRFRNGLAAVMKDGLCGYINSAGNVEVPLRYASARSFHEGFAAVSWPGPQDSPRQVGYINRRGRVAFSDATGSVLELGDFNEGLARVKGGQKWGYLGRNWKIRIEARFDDARDFTGGIAAVRVGQKWGFIDKTGRFVIQPIYDEVDDLDDTLVMVTLDGKIGYVNRVANGGIEPQFQSGLPFFAGYARVGVEPSFAYIMISGRSVWDPRQAVNGFINKRSKENAAIRGREYIIYNRPVDPPPYRDPLPVPYPPDHLYDEVLPPRND